MKKRSILAIIMCLSIVLCFALTSCSASFRFEGSYEHSTSLLITTASTTYTFAKNGNVTIKYFVGGTMLSSSQGKYEVSSDKTEITITIASTDVSTDESGQTEKPENYSGTYKFEYGEDYIVIAGTTYTKAGR